MSRTKASFCVITATIITVMALFFSPNPAPPTLRTAAIRRASLQQTCMLQASVINADTQYLAAPFSGFVEHVYVEVGDNITQDELLIQLDTAAEQQALARLQNQRYQVDSYMEAFASALLPAVTEQLLNWGSTGEQLLAVMKAKQIRASASGFVSNLFVQPGQYVTQGMLLGETCGRDRCVTALWTGDPYQMPRPGMEAWWCRDDGTRVGRLQLESVNVVSETPQLSLQLVFGLADREQLPDTGSKVPVQLVLDTQPDAALVPLEAVADDGSIYLIRDGRVYRERIAYGKSNNEFIQVPETLIGLRVLLEPGRASSIEGGSVKGTEAM